MENNFLIYALQSPKGKLYVGQTDNYDRRMYQHQKDSGCTAIHNAIQKYGWENIKQFRLIEGLTLEQANYFEQHYISIFDCMVHNGYNLRSGGDNSLHSQITKYKMSVAANMPEVKAKKSKALMGNTNSKGKRSDEVKARHKAAKNKHENKMITALASQLQWHEKRLEKEGFFDTAETKEQRNILIIT